MTVAVLLEMTGPEIPTSSTAGVEFLGGPVCCEADQVLETSARFEEARFVCVVPAAALALLCSQMPPQEQLAELFETCSDQFRMILTDKLFEENDIPERVEITVKDIRRSLAPRYLVSC